MDNEKMLLVKNGKNGYGGATPKDIAIGINNGDEEEVPDEDTVTFRDGVRKIDYILAYEDLKEEHDTQRREAFLNALKEEGLDLEIEDKRFSQDTETYFCKVHIPWKLTLVYAEILKIKMPIRRNDLDPPASADCCAPTGVFKPNVEEEVIYFKAPFANDGSFIGYEGKDVPKPDFFSSAQRSRMVHEVLLRARYGEEPQQFGIKRLFGDGIFTAYYPLHDGDYECGDKGVHKPLNKRQELYYEWSRPGAFMKEQPYNAIRHYFGEKAAIYFSWLGFYTLMLVPASIVGIVVFIYGLVTLGTDKTSQDICGTDGGIVMCPQCDVMCNYWYLNQSCLYSKASYVVDNPATIFFAAFMALWTTFFLEFWKRHQARVQYDWDVTDFEENEQNIRPEYQAEVTEKRLNPITHRYEPYMKSSEKCCRMMSSVVSIFFLMCVVLVAILSVIMYRMLIVIVIYKGENAILRSQAKLVTSISAALISVILINILNKVYEKVAVWLTNMETWKYEIEWEDAFTFKMYVFQFANYYGSIIYIGFFKGKLTGSPGHYIRTFGRRGEECDPAGCLIELAIQLGIVMVGNQAVNNFVEIVIPMLVTFYNTHKSKSKVETEDDKYTRWERDYDLVDFPKHGLYEEYLEMVIQYGFVTLFVAAFPLAPFFALLNNVIEVRLDATKMVTQWKRPMAARAQDIGTWFYILEAVSTLAVLSNACIIAFTSDFIDNTLYRYSVGNDPTNNATYIEWSLSTFNTNDFEAESVPDPENAGYTNHSSCSYRGFKSGPDSPTWIDEDPSTHYKFTATFWHVMLAKFVFVVVFEHLVLGISNIVGFLIPDVPSDVQDRTQREKHIAKVSLHERLSDETGINKINETDDTML